MKRIPLLCNKSSISFINSFALSLQNLLSILEQNSSSETQGQSVGGGRNDATKDFKNGRRSFRRAISPASDRVPLVLRG